MDLSKAVDFVPHDLLIAKMHAYGFDMNSLIFFYSYLKRRKQCVRLVHMRRVIAHHAPCHASGAVLGSDFHAPLY